MPNRRGTGVTSSAEFFLSNRARLAIAKLTRASRQCMASRIASIHRLHALDNPRNAPVAAVDLREVTLQSRPLPRVRERSRFFLQRRISVAPGISRSRITYRDSLKLNQALSRPPKEQKVFRIEIFMTWSRQRNIVNRLVPIVNAVTFIRFHCTIREWNAHLPNRVNLHSATYTLNL